MNNIKFSPEPVSGSEPATAADLAIALIKALTILADANKAGLDWFLTLAPMCGVQKFQAELDEKTEKELIRLKTVIFKETKTKGI